LPYFKSVYASCERTGYDVQTFVDLHQIAKLFKIKGYSLFVNNACASGHYAIEAANSLIQSGLIDVAVVASVDSPDIYKYLYFKNLGLYSENGTISPFSEKANGLIFGEGGAAIVLESIENFHERKTNKIYCEYLGGGFDLENWKITAPQPGSESYKNAIMKSIKVAGIEKEDIDLICPHGTAIKITDYYEANALDQLFGRVKSIDYTCLKPYIGHTLGSSALLETVILIKAMSDNKIPKTVNFDNRAHKININLVVENKRKKLNIIMKTCAAFAGFNSSIILKKEDK